MIIEQGWLSTATQLPSTHFNARPCAVDAVIVHGISLPPGEYGGGYIQDFFCGQLETSAHPYFETIKDLRVAAHVLIDRTGQIFQFVSFDDRAWHAGESTWQGRPNCNDYAVGIELEGADDAPYTDAQYTVLAALITALMQAYPALTPERVLGHSDIAPGRKTDPGDAFDWTRLRALILSVA